MEIWAAYNRSGDLIADADSEDALLDEIEAMGYCEDDVLIGRVSP